jgi:hypothetical protein
MNAPAVTGAELAFSRYARVSMQRLKGRLDLIRARRTVSPKK